MADFNPETLTLAELIDELELRAAEQPLYNKTAKVYAEAAYRLGKMAEELKKSK